jgi:hypothetical protein
LPTEKLTASKTVPNGYENDIFSTLIMPRIMEEMGDESKTRAVFAAGCSE